MSLLRQITPADLPALLRDPVDAPTIAAATAIVEAVRQGGEPALRQYATNFGEVAEGAPLVLHPPELQAAFEALPAEDQAMLRRTAERIRAFADMQRASVADAERPISGGIAGQQVAPVDVAACYAPGGRFPLPSSVLMTVLTAKAAGCSKVFVASPKPAQITKAAAYVAEADFLLCCGGAQAIAAMAYGVDGICPRADVIAGPGNKYVTAAKKIVSGTVCAIDMLAGPSELVVLADEHADPEVIAADLLAQAEHDPDALPVLVTTSKALIQAVNQALQALLPQLSTKETAGAALNNGYAVLCGSEDEAAGMVNRLAPEHLEVLTADPQATARGLRHWGGLFLGEGAAEVLGDYGAGPNHTLPTGGTARFTGGLSVFHFLRIRTWMRIDDPASSQELVHDAIRLARHEGLEAHARSAEKRLRPRP